MKINHPKTWLFLALLGCMLIGSLLIIKHHQIIKEQQELQQKIDDHSEIIDTV